MLIFALFTPPQGMVDAGEKVSQTLKREFGEEAMNSLSMPSDECKKVEKAVANLFKHGIEVGVQMHPHIFGGFGTSFQSTVELAFR